MTAINTNTAALNAQYYLAKSNKDMESSMAKLSSGQKVNSAADDAAGLAIASRMTAQIRGLAMAVKNSNDSMSLAQTAEGAMEEVTNMLQRIRELAVQSSNGTMNSSDRASLDAEVQALKAEIDRVATTTTFNSQNLLDGSYTATFQIGDKGGQTVGLQIGSVLTSSLGMGEGSSGANSLVSARVNFSAVDAGDIVINGQALGAISANDHMEDVVQNINDKVDNVKASGFNVVVAENVGNGITGGNGVAASGTFSKTFTIADENLAIGDIIKLNGTSITLSAPTGGGTVPTIATLVADINAQTATTGITASANGNDVTLVGDSVTSVHIAYGTEAEIETTITAGTDQVNPASPASNAVDVSLVLAASDVVANRTYQLEIEAAGGSSGVNATVTYKSEDGDTAQDIMRGLRNALLEHTNAGIRAAYTGTAATTVDVEDTAGTMILRGELDLGQATIDFGFADSNTAFGTEQVHASSTISESGMVITVTEQGVATPTAFTISASSSMDELVDNINAETGGVVTADVNDDGKLVLSNNTGAAITIEDDSTSGSGFSSTATTFNGFLKLESTDGSVVRVESGNSALASPGTVSDVQALGFNTTFQQDESDGYTVKGTALTQPSTAIAKGDLVINGVEMFDADMDTTSFKGKLDVINAFSQQTGVVASASFEQTFSIDSAEIVEGDVYFLNGTQFTIGGTVSGSATSIDVAGVAALINSKSDQVGLTATVNGNNLVLSGDNVQSLTINNETVADKTTGVTSAADATAAAAGTARTITIETADVKAGRTISLQIAMPTATATLDATVEHTVTSTDTATTVAQALADALRNHATATAYDAASAAGLTVGTSGSDGTITIAAALNAGTSTITLSRTDDNDLFRTGQTSGSESTTFGSIKLDSVNNSPIKIDLGQNTTAAAHAANHGLLESNVGAADFDVNEPTLSASGGTSMSGLTVTDAASATKALGTIDTAIDTVNSIRGDLGALQNRLEYTINNLSSISNATTGARGRILDADFAKTTSELTKHQILTQAATSMLAQANQSKQGILALLQG